MQEARLGYCERCGGQIKPVFCIDDTTGNRVLSHGECEYCEKPLSVSEMTMREYRQLPVQPKPIRKD